LLRRGIPSPRPRPHPRGAAEHSVRRRGQGPRGRDDLWVNERSRRLLSPSEYPGGGPPRSRWWRAPSAAAPEGGRPRAPVRGGLRAHGRPSPRFGRATACGRGLGAARPSGRGCRSGILGNPDGQSGDRTDGIPIPTVHSAIPPQGLPSPPGDTGARPWVRCGEPSRTGTPRIRSRTRAQGGRPALKFPRPASPFKGIIFFKGCRIEGKKTEDENSTNCHVTVWDVSRGQVPAPWGGAPAGGRPDGCGLGVAWLPLAINDWWRQVMTRRK